MQCASQPALMRSVKHPHSAAVWQTYIHLSGCHAWCHVAFQHTFISPPPPPPQREFGMSLPWASLCLASAMR